MLLDHPEHGGIKDGAQTIPPARRVEAAQPFEIRAQNPDAEVQQRLEIGLPRRTQA